MIDNKEMNQRGDYDYRVSNKQIRAFKWKDNKVVNFASNYHSTEEIYVKRTQKDGSIAHPLSRTITNMGGVDRADQLRSTYGMIRRSRKWWHSLFWGFLDIAFVNAYVIYNLQFEKVSTFEFRRSISMGFMAMNSCTSNRRTTDPIVKRRKYNYNVSDDVRLGNRGSHWVVYENNRGRCVMCSSRSMQSRPHSKCSTCGIFLCCNQNKICFLEYHDMN